MWYSTKHGVFQSTTLPGEYIKLVSFSRLRSEQPLHLLDAASLFFPVGGAWNIVYFLRPPCRRSAGSFTGGRWRLGGVGGVDVEACDSSSALPFVMSTLMRLYLALSHFHTTFVKGMPFGACHGRMPQPVLTCASVVIQLVTSVDGELNGGIWCCYVSRYKCCV
jgi:hypothetical protein